MNAWKKYGAHALVYIVGALTLVHTYAPLVVPGKGIAIAAGAAVVLAAIHQLQQALSQTPILPAPAPGAASKQSGRASPILLAMLTVAIVALGGCATLQSVMSDPTSAAAVEAAVDLGMGTYIQTTAKTPADQATEATQISAIAGALEAVLSGDTTTLAALGQVLDAKIAAANLNPADKAAAAILAQTLQAVVLQEVQSATGNLSADDVVAVKAILDDVIQAAGFYGVHARAAMRADLAPSTSSNSREELDLSLATLRGQEIALQAQINVAPSTRMAIALADRFDACDTVISRLLAAHNAGDWRSLQELEDELADADPVGFNASRAVSDDLERVGGVLTQCNRAAAVALAQ